MLIKIDSWYNSEKGIKICKIRTEREYNYYEKTTYIFIDGMNEVKDGDIILCHDLHGTTVNGMERVIPDLIAAGYQLVTVSELFSYGAKEVSVGKVYNKIASRSANK